MIDTHSHIYLEHFDDDRDEVVLRAKQAGVEKVLLPNIDKDSISALLDTEKSYPCYCNAMMGLHPTSVNNNYKDELAIVEDWLLKRSFIGIGEIGMDLYWDKTYLREQKDALAIQLKWSVEKKTPVVLHTRDAFPEIFEVFNKVYESDMTGVFHSFTGTVDDAKHILSMPGFYLGINGVVTFKNSNLSKVLSEVGYDRLLLETDAPYLAPVPYRGKRNEPAYVKNTADKLAEIFGVSTQEITATTSKNAQDLFLL